ncbi:MAG: hypothetical protein LBB14_02810 [Puniceicoccales bacterium]|jgi:hypothetical protein|nr:hypothetical protein [Puniceicoccales bacterium]
MKRLLSLTALCGLLGVGSLGAFDLPILTLDARVGFDSEYANRGRKEGQANFQMATETGVPIFGGHGYVGASSVLMLEDGLIDLEDHIGRGGHISGNGSMNEVSANVGFCRSVGGWFTADLSYAYHMFTNLRGIVASGVDIRRCSSEISLGAVGEVLFSPKAYLSYDINRKEFNVSFAAGHTYDLGAVGLDHCAFEGNFFCGYDYARRPFGIIGFFKEDGLSSSERKDYFYYGLGADLIYKYNEQASIRAGMRFCGNSAPRTSWVNDLLGFVGHKDLLWFSSAVEFSF